MAVNTERQLLLDIDPGTVWIDESYRHAPRILAKDRNGKKYIPYDSAGGIIHNLIRDGVISVDKERLDRIMDREAVSQSWLPMLDLESNLDEANIALQKIQEEDPNYRFVLGVSVNLESRGSRYELSYDHTDLSIWMEIT